MASVTRFIEGKLKLKVNLAKSAVGKPEERHFVGFRLMRDALTGDVEVDISARSRDRINEKIREATRRNRGESLERILERLNAYLVGWIGFFWIILGPAAERTLNNLDAHIRRRLRALILKQWKRQRSIARKLIKLGIREKTAWKTVYEGRRSLWDLSHRPAVERALAKAYFTQRGLTVLHDWWRAKWDRVIVPVQLELGLDLG